MSSSVQGSLLALYSDMTLDGAQGPYVMPEIKPRLITCKTSKSPTCCNMAPAPVDWFLDAEES